QLLLQFLHLFVKYSCRFGRHIYLDFAEILLPAPFLFKFLFSAPFSFSFPRFAFTPEGYRVFARTSVGVRSLSARRLRPCRHGAGGLSIFVVRFLSFRFWFRQ